MHERCDNQKDDINDDTSVRHSTSSASRRNGRLRGIGDDGLCGTADLQKANQSPPGTRPPPGWVSNSYWA
jgi:hypothetical protein